MEHGCKTILCVDDDPDDRWLLTEAFSQMEPPVQVIEAENGLKAMDYLNVHKSGGPLPDIVILDLNMPYLDGRETLSRIKADPALSRLPVVIFTSSQNPAEKARFNEEGVPFLSKPYNMSMMPGIVGDILSHCA